MERKHFFTRIHSVSNPGETPNFTNAREVLALPRQHKSLPCVDLAAGSLSTSAHKGDCPLRFQLSQSLPQTAQPSSLLFCVSQNTLIIFLPIQAFARGWALENKCELLRLIIALTNTLCQCSSFMGSSIRKLLINKICRRPHPSLATYYMKRCIIPSTSSV